MDMANSHIATKDNMKAIGIRTLKWEWVVLLSLIMSNFSVFLEKDVLHKVFSLEWWKIKWQKL